MDILTTIKCLMFSLWDFYATWNSVFFCKDTTAIFYSVGISVGSIFYTVSVGYELMRNSRGCWACVCQNL